MQNKKEKLNGKDFINIGIFTAIYMVIVIVIACTVGLIPIGFILLPIILPIIGGIPMLHDTFSPLRTRDNIPVLSCLFN